MENISHFGLWCKKENKTNIFQIKKIEINWSQNLKWRLDDSYNIFKNTKLYLKYKYMLQQSGRRRWKQEKDDGMHKKNWIDFH